jgi:CubicO group peptidase (beta-lactamase class C family)
MTKPVTAVATLLLIEECVLRLDESVERLLPELANRRVVRRINGPIDDTVPAVRPITVRDLLTFRMGFGAYFGPCPVNDAAEPLAVSVGPPAPQQPPEPDEWMRRLSSQPLMCQPGERWLYHTGADVLGVLIARASGVAFDRFLRERIFEPLGMKDTAFFVPPQDLGRLVTSYTTDDLTGALEIYDEPTGQWSEPPSFPLGGAGLLSTAGDFFAFAEMLLRGCALTVPALGRDHDYRSANAGSKGRGRFLPRRFRRSGLGFLRRYFDPAPRSFRPGRSVRLGRRAGHHMAKRSFRTDDHPVAD